MVRSRSRPRTQGGGSRTVVAPLAGYAETSRLKLVGDRHRLVERQRIAVMRSACSDAALASRQSRRVEVDTLRGQSLRIDGFNLILTLESALGGGVILGGRDGCYRDLASVHGTYRRVEETRPAIELASRWLTDCGVVKCIWLLDSPVSNSGRLAQMIRAVNSTWAAEVVANPDSILVQPGEVIATADGGILDRCGPWVNLARAIVEASVRRAFLIDFNGERTTGARHPPACDLR